MSVGDLRETVEWAIGWLDEAQGRKTVKNMRSAVAIAKANLRAALAASEGEGREGQERTMSDLDDLDAAWGIIANAGGGDWSKETPEWQEAAARWRDRVMPGLAARPVAPEPRLDVERLALALMGSSVGTCHHHPAWTERAALAQARRLADEYANPVNPDDRDAIREYAEYRSQSEAIEPEESPTIYVNTPDAAMDWSRNDATEPETGR